MPDDSLLVVGLGANLGSEATIMARFAAVARSFEAWGTVRASRVYRSAPLGPPQPDYLNAALAVETPPELAASEILREVRAIEQALGRRRAAETRLGPRAIDVDILLWGNRTFDLDRGQLIVPHPRLAERRFALAPVIDLVGADALHPGLGRRLSELAAAASAQRVEVTTFEIDGAAPAIAPATDG